MTVATIGDRIMETLIYKGPMSVEGLSEELQTQTPMIRRGLAMLFEEDKIEGTSEGLVQAVRHG